MMLSERSGCIGVLCDILVDRYIFGTARSLGIEYAVPLLEDASELDVLGGGGNLVKSLARIESITDVVSIIGDGEADDIALNLLAVEKVDTEQLVKVESWHTPVCGKVVARVESGVDREVARIDWSPGSGVASSTRSQIAAICKEVIARSNVFAVSAYREADQSCLDEVVWRICRESCEDNRVISVVASRSPLFAYKGADYVVLNERELAQHASAIGSDASRSSRCLRSVAAALGCRTIVVTLGARGCIAWDSKISAFQSCTADELPPGVDTTGAGDVFLAAFCDSIARGLDTAQAIKHATCTATGALHRKERPAALDPVRSMERFCYA